MWTKQFWLDTAERAAKTAAQSAIGVFVAGQTVLTIDWAQSGAIVGTAVLVSVLTSIASRPRRSSFVTIRMSPDSSLSMSREKPRRCAMAVLPETVSVTIRRGSTWKPAASIS